MASARQLEALIAGSRSLEVLREGRDRYGRTLARLRYDGGRDIGDAMINLGMAAKWTGRRWDWCAPPDYDNAAGPAMLSGPEENGAFMRWAGERMTHDLQRNFAPLVRTPAPATGQASTPAR